MFHSDRVSAEIKQFYFILRAVCTNAVESYAFFHDVRPSYSGQLSETTRAERPVPGPWPWCHAMHRAGRMAVSSRTCVFGRRLWCLRRKFDSTNAWS